MSVVEGCCLFKHRHSDSDFFHLNLSPNRQITRPKKVEPVIPILNLRGTKEREAAG